ncbi:M10 family metallopeptidase C-terminal domain-containing protein [Pseudomonas gozinkensis]|uniref:M10 family metallopeptidase C-terminal domain-containing protein n=1 Tax=Pseudomonas gozinkensis TaxID=2774461 RepID=UPI00178875F4|nr:M10 family metallopeptidase C-terminal domain-containing protein [Pseudomonas gozinkensis]
MSSPLGYALTQSSFLTGNTQADSLIYGTQWLSPDFGGEDFLSTRLTYSFVTVGQSYFARDYTPDNEFLNSFNLTTAQQSAITSALNNWSSVANIKFTLVSDNINSAGDLRFGGYSGMDPKTAAWAYFPDEKPSAGDVWIGPVTNDPNPVKGTYDYMTFVHEIGHALGLKHPFEASTSNSNVISPLLDDSHFTVMSYNNAYSYQPTTPMLLDILVIQKLYGANMLWQTGDNVYKWGANQSVFETIWDAGGNDTIDASNQLAPVSLNLNEGAFSQIGKAFTDGTNLLNDGLAIAYGAKIENAIGSAFDDVLTGNDLNNTLDGGLGADTMMGGAGIDTYYVDNVNDVVIETDASLTAIDRIFSSVSYSLGANVENLLLTGSANINATGNEVVNRLVGNDGNNILDGGLGADRLEGGLGNDTYIVDNVGDIVIETSALANEIDTVQASVSYSLSANVEDLILTGTAHINGTGNSLSNTLTGNAGNNILDGGLGADRLEGGLGNDTYIVDNVGDIVIETSTLANEIDTVRASIDWTLGANLENLVLTGNAIYGTGNNLDNTLTGNDQDNVLNGGVGADIMIGGAGIDTYYVDNVNDVVIETDASLTAIDRIFSRVSYSLGANVENLLLTGSANINATGNEVVNRLVGNDGNNILDGGLGADRLEGGLGNDTYIVDNVGDIVIETSTLANEIDTVQASVSYSLSANVEDLILTGTAHINGTGNSLSNTLTGNAGNNILDGGLGADRLEGGLGNDTYIVDNVADQIIETSNNANEIDTVRASIDWTLGANLENLVLTGNAIYGTGNNLDNTLTGNDQDNVLNGGAGADIMIGGAGIDTYYVDNVNDVVIETDASLTAIDRIFSRVSYSLGANVENLLLTGSDNINATGNEVVNRLVGNAGNNILDGGLGADRLEGGLGNDTYIVDNVGDIVIETSTLANEIDTVRASIDWTLGANLENLVLTGNAIYGTGNNLDNTLTGNDQDNVLNGGVGADIMIGGAGIDTYYVDNVNDVVIETDASLTAIDRIFSRVSYSLGANVENLLLTGSANINATGNEVVNRLVGNDGNNILDGGLGADRLEGGLGNDTYIVDNVGDIVIETSALANEIDTVQASVSYSLSANVEDLILTGTAHINGTGNSLSNTLTGNAGNNILDGGLGADRLEGGLGNDTYIVDNVADQIIETSNNANEIDTVRASIDWTLGANLENLVLTGNAIYGTGNNLDNTLTGNDQDNVLNGGAGADIMIGGAGIDTYYVDNVNDVVIETDASLTAIDRIFSRVSYSLGANVENLLLTGSDNINATGNEVANRLVGNAGNNILDGGLGADRLEGGLGTDTLTGGAGADTFIFNNWNETGTGSLRDVITDFSSAQGDKIDLSKFDANLLSAGFNGFSFIGAADFTGAGQLRFVDHVLSGNVSGNVGADFEIQLVGVNAFSASDLVA